MKRALLCLAFGGAFVAMPVMAGTAGAVKPTTASLVLTCDKGVSSNASVTLYAASDVSTKLAGPIALSCNASQTRDAETVDIHGTARFASIGPWTYTKGGGILGQCGGGIELPANVPCGPNNAGATLKMHG